MAKVTYLFGAGASAKCLPIVSQIPGRLNDFLSFVEANRTGQHATLSGGFSTAMAEDDFLNELKDLIFQVEKHQSIDTYAKKLRITGAKSTDLEIKYHKLKAIISCFFIYEQLIHEIDDRYDAFFASILGDSDLDLPKDLRILSWNYDFQFEKAFSAYSMSSSLSTNQGRLNVYPGSGDVNRYQPGFSIFKLNGTTGFRDKSTRLHSHLNDEMIMVDPANLIFRFMSLYCSSFSNDGQIKPLLSFAWERDWNADTKKMLEMAKSATLHTDVLVIVGYSIPFFNRQVDRYLFEQMELVEAIYIQDKNPRAVMEKLPSVFGFDLPKKIELIDQVDQFFLPPEL